MRVQGQCRMRVRRGGMVMVLVAAAVVGMPGVSTIPPAGAAHGPVGIGLQPPVGAPGAEYRVQGCGFDPGGGVAVRWDGEQIASGEVDARGCVSVASLAVPADAVDGPHVVEVADGEGHADDKEFVVTFDPYVVVPQGEAVRGELAEVVGCNWPSSPVVLAVGDGSPVSLPTSDGCFDGGVPVADDAALGVTAVTATAGTDSAGTSVAVVRSSARARSLARLHDAGVGLADVDVANPFGPWAMVEVDVEDGDPAEAAIGFLEEYRVALGMQDPSSELFLRTTRTATLRTLRFGQQFDDVEVCVGEVWVGMGSGVVHGVHGRWLDGPPTASSSPSVPSNRAQAVALEAAGGEVLRAPSLCWWSDVLAGTGDGRPVLAWRVDLVSGPGTPLGTVYVDAADGSVLLALPSSEAAWDFVDGQPSRDTACGYLDEFFGGLSPVTTFPTAEFATANDAMHTVNDGFFRARFGHDGSQDTGWDRLIIRDSNIPSNLAPNALYQGACMQFSPGWATPDVVSHEFGHGVSRAGVGLIYAGQSGAWSESFADTWAMLVDCTDGSGCGRDDFRIGEGLPGGALRDMLDPRSVGDPARFGGTGFANTDPAAPDNGGVHTNSAVPNLAAALLVNGGTRSGYRIDKVHVDRLARLVYSMNSDLLLPWSSLPQGAAVARAAARTFATGGQLTVDPGLSLFSTTWDVPAGYGGWTLDDACQVRNAYAAVGLGTGDADCDGTPDNLDGPDPDGDGISSGDNCPWVANPGTQSLDLDGDGAGDDCDGDLDGDGLLNVSDPCPRFGGGDMNADFDGDGTPDACDDTDGDGVSDADDNCRSAVNPDQTNTDGADDGGDACDPDDDNDATPDDDDLCPKVVSGGGDGDGDGVGDECDNCPTVSNGDQANSDGANDGGDACDDDDDDDGLLDAADNCPTVANPDQADVDGNGVGYVCDGNEQQALHGDLLQLTVPTDGLRIPIDGCLVCGEQTLYSDLWSHVLDVDSTGPIELHVYDPSGLVVASTLGTDGLSLTFAPDAAAAETLRLTAAARHGAAAPPPSGSGQYVLEVSPRGASAPVQVTVRAEDVATTPAEVERLAGADRYATSVEAAGMVGSRGTVYVATGQNFPDALAGGPAAVADGGPVLLTPTGRLASDVAAELDQRLPTEIVVLGGAAAVSEEVVTALEAWAPVRRVAGANRYETAAAVAAGFARADRVYLATGENYPDALTGGAVAATEGVPVLLTTPSSLPAATAAQLQRLDPQEVVVLGGAAAVADEVLDEVEQLLGRRPSRIFGPDRYATAAVLAAGFDPGVDTVLVATGRNFPDAIAGVPAAHAARAPVLLVSTSLPDVVADRLAELRPRRVTVLGGPAAVPAELDDVLRAHVQP